MNSADGPNLILAEVERTHSWWRAALRYVWIAVGWAALAAVLFWSTNAGLTVRRWAWDETRTIRFTFDIGNGFNQGSRVYESMTRLAAAENRPPVWRDFFAAYLNNYADVVDHSVNGDYKLDYTPARLLVMSLWVKHLRESNPPITEWNSGYKTTEPLLQFNTACEAVSAIAMFALVRHWRRAQQGRSIWPHWRHPWREWPAVLAGLAVWFNPALVWNAHVWPQWDCWLLPFFLLGVLAASKDRWLLAGFVMLIGASFKGQVLMILPVVLLWPILIGRPMAAVRLIIGGGAFAALMALPWMLYTGTAIVWLILMFIAAIGTAVVFARRRKFDLFSVITATLAAMVIAPVMVRPEYSIVYVLGPLLILATAVLPRWTPRHWLPVLVLAELSMAVFLAGFAFGGQFQWFEIGFIYPQRHYPIMVMSGANLANILAGYGWHLTDPLTLPWVGEMTMRSFLIALFIVCLAICSVGTAINARRRSPMILMSLAVPWVMLFTVMPQMHERYLLWGAVLMCAGVGISVGQGLLAAAVTFLAWANMAAPVLPNNPRLLPNLTAVLRGMFPGSAWGLMLLAAVCLYTAVVTERRKRKGVAVEAEPVGPDDTTIVNVEDATARDERSELATVAAQ